MSLTLAKGKTIAIRFIFAGCCARAASGHIVAAPPKSVMNSRRCMYPPEGRTHRHLKPNTFDGAAGEKGQPVDLGHREPMSVGGQKHRFVSPAVASGPRQQAD